MCRDVRGKVVNIPKNLINNSLNPLRQNNSGKTKIGIVGFLPWMKSLI